MELSVRRERYAMTQSGPETPGFLVAWRVRSLRKQLGLKQDEMVRRLAEQGLEISQATYSRIEVGKSEIVKGANYLVGLATALDCSVTYLLGLTSKPSKWTPD